MKINYGSGTISPEEVVRSIALTTDAGVIWNRIILEKEARGKAREIGIEITTKELQACADAYRQSRGLELAEDTDRFLDAIGMTVDDFEAYCESVVLIEKLKESLASPQKIEEYFANNRHSFDTARLSMILADRKELLDEIKMQVEEDGESFHELARKHTQDENSRYSGGYIGIITRDALEDGVAAKVFTASAGDVVGPVEDSKPYRLFLVEDIFSASLEDDAVMEVVKSGILSDWLSEAAGGPIKVEP